MVTYEIANIRYQIARFPNPNLSAGCSLPEKMRATPLISNGLFGGIDDPMADTLTSIRLSDDKIEIVNQLLLPHTTEWLTIASIEQAHDAIKSMKVGTLCYALQKSRLQNVCSCCPVTDPWRTGHRFSCGAQRLATPFPGSASPPSTRVPLVTGKPQGSYLPDSRLFVHRTSDCR